MKRKLIHFSENAKIRTTLHFREHLHTRENRTIISVFAKCFAKSIKFLAKTDNFLNCIVRYLNIFTKINPLLQMLLTCFAFFLGNLKKNQLLFIFAKIFAQVFEISGRNVSIVLQAYFPGNATTNIFVSSLVMAVEDRPY